MFVWVNETLKTGMARDKRRCKLYKYEEYTQFECLCPFSIASYILSHSCQPYRHTQYGGWLVALVTVSLKSCWMLLGFFSLQLVSLLFQLILWVFGMAPNSDLAMSSFERRSRFSFNSFQVGDICFFFFCSSICLYDALIGFTYHLCAYANKRAAQVNWMPNEKEGWWVREKKNKTGNKFKTSNEEMNSVNWNSAIEFNFSIPVYVGRFCERARNILCIGM